MTELWFKSILIGALVVLYVSFIALAIWLPRRNTNKALSDFDITIDNISAGIDRNHAIIAAQQETINQKQKAIDDLTAENTYLKAQALAVTSHLERRGVLLRLNKP